MNINEINSLKNFSFSCIYLWTNNVNNKHYVGQAHNFYNRIAQYKKGHFNQYMKKAIEKYGIDNFDITVLEKDVSFDKLNEREQYLLDYYQSYKSEYGYNICQYASTTYGIKYSQETKDKLSKINKERFENYPKSKPCGSKNGMYDKKHTDEWKSQYSDFLKEKWETDEEYRKFWHDRMSGENNPMYGIHLVGELNPRYGQHLTEETKEKISKTNSKKVKIVELDMIFDSAKECDKYLGYNGAYTSQVCDKPNRTAKGYHIVKVKE